MNKLNSVQNRTEKYCEDLNLSLLNFRNSLFFIRPIEYNDLQALFTWRSDPKINQYLASHPPKNMQEQIQWYKKYMNDIGSIHFIAFMGTPQNIEIGYCQLFNIDRLNKAAEYGVVLGNTRSIGTGLGLKLTLTFVKIIFYFMEFRTLFANVNSENSGANSIVRDFLGSIMVIGPHKYSKDNETLFSLEKPAFEIFERNLVAKYRKWEKILNVEQTEILNQEKK